MKNISEILDIVKQLNIHITVFQKGKMGKVIEYLFQEIPFENVPYLEKQTSRSR